MKNNKTYATNKAIQYLVDHGVEIKFADLLKLHREHRFGRNDSCGHLYITKEELDDYIHWQKDLCIWQTLPVRSKIKKSTIKAYEREYGIPYESKYGERRYNPQLVCAMIKAHYSV